jgi:hypothetical protein
MCTCIASSTMQTRWVGLQVEVLEQLGSSAQKWYSTPGMLSSMPCWSPTGVMTVTRRPSPGGATGRPPGETPAAARCAPAVASCGCAGCVGHTSVHSDRGLVAWGSGVCARVVLNSNATLRAQSPPNTGSTIPYSVHRTFLDVCLFQPNFPLGLSTTAKGEGVSC